MQVAWGIILRGKGRFVQKTDPGRQHVGLGLLLFHRWQFVFPLEKPYV